MNPHAVITNETQFGEGSLTSAFPRGKTMKMNIPLMLAAPFVLATIFGLSGCSTVQPWEKQNLAKPEMTFEGDRLDTSFTEHIYSSKEGASGGAGVGGGGCGCN